MSDRAAIFSPRILTFMERKEAETPVANRAGTVPRPKATMVRKPRGRLCVVAAFAIMAQESPQGRNPVARPRAILASRRGD